MTLDKLRLGSGKRLRTDGLVPLPDQAIPYDPGLFPGAIVLASTSASDVDQDIPFFPYISRFQGAVPRWLQILTLNNDRRTLSIGAVTTLATSAPAIVFARSRGIDNNVLDGDLLGELGWRARAGGAANKNSSIQAKVAGTPVGTSVPTQLELQTTSAGAAGAAVRVIVTPSGNVLINNTTGTERLSVTGNIQLTATADSYMVGTNNVVGSRKTGWAAPTGTATRSAFATSSVTTTQLAERVKALIDDLTSHGLIGA